ncbi:MAG: phosphodiester glycosidase family protein [Thermoflavifilum aggregans]|nr:phosphodiester glycosidase family protein [Thermoflavifilum aggregans]
MRHTNYTIQSTRPARKVKRRYVIVLLFLSVFFSPGCRKDSGTRPAESPTGDSTGSSQTYAQQLANADWDSTWVSDAVLWKYYHFLNLFSAPESITVFDVDLNNKKLTVKIPYVTTGSFLKTSEGAASVGAVAAINGSYFDTKNGGSTVFFKIQGKIITQTSTAIPSYRDNAGLSIDKNGKVSIIRRPTSGWETTNTYDLLTSGPILIYNGEVMDQVDDSFNNERNPRTAVGLTDDNHLIAVVVDGRFSQSAGMTTKELAEVMQALGCQTAMNLDGGGSSTAWVKDRGVVNYPSDNKQFDHGGERAVATVIAFVMKN